MIAGAPALKNLERLKAAYGGDAAERKLALLEALEARALRGAREVLRLHEALCFLRAYPDDGRVLSRVDAMLRDFADRRDLARHRAALEDTGIAGTAIRYRFFAPTASWLASRFGRRLTIDWKAFDGAEKLEPLLPLLAHYGESPGLDGLGFDVREWIERLKGPDETDAAFVVRRFDRLPMDAFAREALYDSLDVPLVLAPGPDTPSRTRARLPVSRVAFQTRPLDRARPDLSKAVKRPPASMRPAEGEEAERIIDLARGMMVTLLRDLDVFSWADPRDVRIAECGRGLALAFLGAIPERRLLLEALYGYLILQNGAPIGYGTVSALYGSSEIAFNVSETFRGAETGFVFGRLLACARYLLGVDAFTLDPYQLGEGNDEAIRTGAWWFYQKLGFRPRDREALRRMREELRRMKADPSHRTGPRELRRLAGSALFWHEGKPRDDVIGVLPLAGIGLAVTRLLARRFGADRERGEKTCSREAAALLGVRSLRELSSGERLAWKRWAPLVAALPGVDGWPASDRRALAAVIRAKGGRRESDFVRRFDAHLPLRRALRELAGREP